jgi:predicted transposase YdaD
VLVQIDQILFTKKDAQSRKLWKFQLIRRLYERDYNRRDIVNLFKFIDWAMILPEDIDQEFWSELKTYEEERRMPYITSVERIGFERGRQEGERAERSLVLRQLSRRVGTLPEAIQAQVTALPLDQLESLGEALLDFTSLANLEEWLTTQVNSL